MNLAPILTFALYTVIAVFWKDETLLTAQAFTSVSLISLLTSPVVIFIQSLPNVVQCLGMFERIQEFCNDSLGYSDEGDRPHGSGRLIDSEKLASIESKPPRGKESFVLSHLSFCWNKDQPPVLKDLNVKIHRGSTTAIVGPVGSGKSAFLNGLLGELMPISSRSGTAPIQQQILSERTAYCAQQPWLENGTICQNIVGKSVYDQRWYSTVKAACGLDIDIEKLKRADQTLIGSDGLNLSGGQKQRIVSTLYDPLQRTLTNILYLVEGPSTCGIFKT